jgi:HAD superfamily hydrolase (TIGR01509 family)
MIKAVIFDLNGVFLKSEYLSSRMKDTFGVETKDFVPALNSVMDVVRKPNAPKIFNLWKPYFEKWGLNLQESEFLNFWFSGEQIIPELVEYVKELRDKKIEVYVLSNNFRERTEYYRKQFTDLFNEFSGAYFSWETGFVKPEKEAYENLMTEHKLRPEECVYFDDSQKNIDVALGLGIKAAKYVGLNEAKTFIEGKANLSKER